jgi:hypothetical protein
LLIEKQRKIMKIPSQFWQNVRGIILVATAFWFCAETGAAFTVTSSADDGGANTLRSAIAGAALDPNIQFALPSGSTIMLTKGELLISMNMTITGPGATNLSIVNTNGRVFHIPTGVVTISGLTMTGHYKAPNGANGTIGHLDGYPGTGAFGGGILDESPDLLVVSNCFMINCWANGGNGGDAFNGESCSGPSLGNGGDGGYASGGALCHTTGDLILQGCTFLNNDVWAGNGGMGHDGGKGGNAGVVNEPLFANGAGAGGGAVEVEYGSATFSLINCTFFYNYASGGHGGQGGNGWTNCIGAPSAGGAGGASGTASGGAIYVIQGCNNCGNIACRGLDSCTVYYNWCQPHNGGPGGAGFANGAPGAAGNPGTAYGCGLFFENVGCLKMDNTIIAGSWASGGFVPVGPDVYVAGGGNITSLGWNFIGDATGSGGHWAIT